MPKSEPGFIDLPKNRISQRVQNTFFENLEHEKHIGMVLDESGHINGQGRYPICEMNLGRANAGNTVCEVIAVYNVLKDLKRHESLSKLIFYDEALGYLFAMGFFGTKINKLGVFLQRLSIPNKKIAKKEFLYKAKNDLFENKQKFVISIMNRTDVPVSSIHTFEAVYENKKWKVYNRFNEDTAPRYYSNTEDILKNGRQTGAYLAIYMINESKDTETKNDRYNNIR